MNAIPRSLVVVAVVALLLGGCGGGHSEDDGHDHAAENEHVGHDHSEDAVREADAHPEDEHDHAETSQGGGAPDTHEHGEQEGSRVELSPTQRERLGLRLATAEPGAIEMARAFPGEITLNPERMAHIVPRATGVVRQVAVSLGDYVQAGEPLAWIESGELAKAKLAFYADYAEVGSRRIELPRALDIFENTNRLLVLLEKESSPEELQELKALEMGEYRGQLLTAYAEYIAAKKTQERERALFDKSISSESELVAAEAGFIKAQANFEAAKDRARYQVLIAYMEAARKRQVAEFAAVASEQDLRLKGVGDDVLSRLLALVPQTASLEPCLCDDPNCEHGEFPSILETIGTEERLGWYALQAPFAGFVTEKHLTLGEKVSADESVITIADTSTIWVRFSVYQRDLSLVAPGQDVRIDLGAGLPRATGTIAYVSPIVDKETRTAQARVELANPDGVLRPGLYATAHVDVGSFDSPVTIHRDAVQILDDEEVVFVEDGGGFVPKPVRLGRSAGDRVVVLAGLEPGQRYVVKGAFEMKAQIVTSGLDPHAGHGH